MIAFLHLFLTLLDLTSTLFQGFTEHVKELHTLACAHYCSWRADGKPRSRPLCFATLMDKDMTSFWSALEK